MKTNRSLFFTATFLLTAFLLNPAKATDYTFSATLDLSSPTIVASSSTLQLENFYFQGTLPTFNLAVGDTISGTISFANSEVLTMTNPGGAFDSLSLLFVLPPVTNNTNSTGTLSFSGVTGSLTPAIIGVGGNAAIGVEAAAITNSSVSFTGLTYQVTLQSIQDSFNNGFTPSYLQAGVSGSGAGPSNIIVGAVPEPSTWVLLLTGAGFLAFFRLSARKSAL
jgi:hypothetical protein